LQKCFYHRLMWIMHDWFSIVQENSAMARNCVGTSHFQVICLCLYSYRWKKQLFFLQRFFPTFFIHKSNRVYKFLRSPLHDRVTTINTIRHFFKRFLLINISPRPLRNSPNQILWGWANCWFNHHISERVMWKKLFSRI
jgi:hypothetical protein